jgi:hypothetical protein
MSLRTRDLMTRDSRLCRREPRYHTAYLYDAWRQRRGIVLSIRVFKGDVEILPVPTLYYECIVPPADDEMGAQAQKTRLA